MGGNGLALSFLVNEIEADNGRNRSSTSPQVRSGLIKRASITT